MDEASIIGIDLAKHVFQLHGMGLTDRWHSAASFSDGRFSRSWRGDRVASWRWRPARRRITGAGRSEN